MQAQGIISGKYIELLEKTNLPDDPVIVQITAKELSLEDKTLMIDTLCGTWTTDDSLNAIFDEIERDRRKRLVCSVNFDVTSSMRTDPVRPSRSPNNSA